MKQKKRLFAFVAISLFTFRSVASPSPPSTEVSQYILGSNGCGPTALFYLLKRGPDALRHIYEKLQGTDDTAKLKNLLILSEGKTSRLNQKESRFEPSRGMNVYDLLATAQDLFSHVSNFSLSAQSLNRTEKENTAGSLLKRSYFLLQKSMIQNVPVIANILPYVGTKNLNSPALHWKEYRGHYIVITHIPENLREGALGFTFQYLDPATGTSHEAYLYEEVTRDFSAREDFPNGTADWVHSKVKFEGKEIVSPFLNISAPHLNLAPPDILSTQRLILSFSTILGKF